MNFDYVKQKLKLETMTPFCGEVMAKIRDGGFSAKVKRNGIVITMTGEIRTSVSLLREEPKCLIHPYLTISYRGLGCDVEILWCNGEINHELYAKLYKYCEEQQERLKDDLQRLRREQFDKV